MRENFWKKLNEPFFCLAPMSDVTDSAFRYLLAKYGKNSDNINSIVFWAEFVAADGLCNKFARKKLAHILKFSPAEKPIVAQVFGANPENMKKACQYISSLGFDGIDINMGCPDKSVVAQGAGSALIRTPALARKIIQSAIEGTAVAGQYLPISVKTRIGFNKEEIDTWIPELLKEDISALTVHLRTKKEESLVPANWSLIPRIRDLINKSGKDILLIGNGDVVDIDDARRKCKEYGCDGVMIGRGVFGKPDFFATTSEHNLTRHQNDTLSSTEERNQWILFKIKTLVEHIRIFDKELLKTGDKSYAVMKKHFKAYLSGFPGAQELRNKLMLTNKPSESISILSTYLKTLK